MIVHQNRIRVALRLREIGCEIQIIGLMFDHHGMAIVGGNTRRSAQSFTDDVTQRGPVRRRLTSKHVDTNQRHGTSLQLSNQRSASPADRRRKHGLSGQQNVDRALRFTTSKVQLVSSHWSHHQSPRGPVSSESSLSSGPNKWDGTISISDVSLCRPPLLVHHATERPCH
jgi:hypothetical protein